MNRADIRKIKRKTNIVNVIRNFVKLEKSGTSFKSLSPFVKEKTPSFFVSPSKQIFKCFASGKGGDVIEFLQSFSWKCENPECGHETHSLTKNEAIKMIIDNNYYKK